MAKRNHKRQIQIGNAKNNLPLPQDFTEGDIEKSNPWKKKKTTVEQQGNIQFGEILDAQNKKPRTLEELKGRVLKSKEEANLSRKTHCAFVGDLLNDDEKRFYELRRVQYEEDYEINNSSDEVLLHTILMDEIRLLRLYQYQALNPAKTIDGPLDACINRIGKTLKQLSMTREQRVGTKVTIENSISDLAARIAVEKENMEISKIKMQEEEEYLLRKKREREESGQEPVLEGEFTEIPDAPPLEDIEDENLIDLEDMLEGYDNGTEETI